MVSGNIRYFSEYREVTGTLHGSPNWTRAGGGAPLSLSYSASLSSFATPEKEKGEGNPILGLGSPSRTPHTWRAPRGPASSSSPLYIRGKGAPQMLGNAVI